MKEEFLHYVWQFSLFSLDDLQTTKGDEIRIVKPGVVNKNSGPDFLESHLVIDNQKWVGNVEIHLKSSDWYVHNHEIDSNYDAVILHVVFEDDEVVFMKNNISLPTLVLKDRINKTLFNNYKNLFSNNIQWIPCEKDIAKVDSFTFGNWIERLYLERLEDKSVFIEELLELNNNDYEAVLFSLLAKNFGLKVNGDSFLQLAQTIPFSIIRKEWFLENNFSALLFGTAGFLEDDFDTPYFLELKREYGFLKKKYKLKTLDRKQFQFFRMRPNNFPTIRLAQFIALYIKNQNLFSKLIEVKTLEDFYDMFLITVNNFWQTHYTFEKESKKSLKKITKQFVNLLIINTIIPLKFVYFKKRGQIFDFEELKFLVELPSEKNSVIRNFSECGINVKNAFESQALLQLKNKYCDSKKCLTCKIGVFLLND